MNSLSRRLALSLLAAAAFALVACNDSPSTPAASSASGAPASPPTPEALKDKVAGFTVGALMARNTVYVFFDMQCPHCGHLWEASQPLTRAVKFAWVPVAILGRASLAQGATILAAAEPAKAMVEHEASLLARRGGMTADDKAPDTHGDKVKANTELLRSLGVTSVPYILARNARTGAVVAQEGAMDTAALRELLGL